MTTVCACQLYTTNQKIAESVWTTHVDITGSAQLHQSVHIGNMIESCDLRFDIIAHHSEAFSRPATLSNRLTVDHELFTCQLLQRCHSGFSKIN